MNNLDVFRTRGYELFSSQSRDTLDGLRKDIFDFTKKLVPYKGESVDDFFNFFHKYDLSGADLNRVRIAVIEHMTNNLEVGERLYRCFEEPLTRLVGADIAVQKGINLVVQPPGDLEQAPIHRDAPGNSNYEVIVWVPLVNVFRTKSMWMTDKQRSLESVRMLKAGKSYKEYCDFSSEEFEDLKVDYGQACFFAGGITHGVHTNQEPETRWSLNLRYKGLFTPYGSKGLSDFFRILRVSPLTSVAFEFDRMEHEQRLSP